MAAHDLRCPTAQGEPLECAPKWGSCGGGFLGGSGDLLRGGRGPDSSADGGLGYGRHEVRSTSTVLEEAPASSPKPSLHRPQPIQAYRARGTPQTANYCVTSPTWPGAPANIAKSKSYASLALSSGDVKGMSESTGGLVKRSMARVTQTHTQVGAGAPTSGSPALQAPQDRRFFRRSGGGMHRTAPGRPRQPPRPAPLQAPPACGRSGKRW